MNIKRLAAVLLTGLGFSMSAHTATAQTGSYPEREVRIVVPWSPGGFTDRLARMLAERLTHRLGRQVIVENRPGASGLIGSTHVARSAPDGLTLLLTTTDGTVKMLGSQQVDPVADYTNIATLASQPVTLTVHADVPANSLQEYVALAKKSPRSITYASNGEGGATHLGMEMFARIAGIELTHVPYKGAAPALTDVMGGQTKSLLISVQGLSSNINSDRLKVLAVTAPKRLAAAPNIPTFAEAGYPQFGLHLWYALVGPKGIPADIAQRLNREVNEILATPELASALTAAAADPKPASVQESQAFVEQEAARWNEVVKATPLAQ